MIGLGLVAERQGFEPWIVAKLCWFSRPDYSTNLTSKNQCECVFQRIGFLMLSTMLSTNDSKSGGESGIRTLERLASLPVFKTVAFDHYANSP